MPTLLDRLAAWKPFTAVVVGDLMLDQLVYGHAERLCNDAPVPVLHVQRTEERPGGSANVALDLLALRGRVRTVGVRGDDFYGVRLGELLERSGVDATGLVADASRPTTVKKNLIGLAQHRHAQKMFRLDYESSDPIGEAVVVKLVAAFERALVGADVVCLEDYGKGVCTPALCGAVIERAKKAGVPVMVDPASIADYSKYAGASTITPNRIEAAKATGLKLSDEGPPEQYGQVAERLMSQLGLEAAVITLDRHGALLLEREGEARVVPTVARRVYDVTGAGDMVLAALAAARANGIGWFDAVRFANAAAGLEVEEFGVVPIPLERIHADVLLRERSTRGKLRTVGELAVEVAAARARGKKIVFTNGVFDVPHAGHVALLREARSHGDFLIVAINCDEKVRQYKGPNRPVFDQNDRAAMLGAFEDVDAVVVFEEDTPASVIERIAPDVLVKGAQYNLDEIPGAAFVIASGGRVVRAQMVQGRSSTATLERLDDPRAQITRPADQHERFIRDPAGNAAPGAT